MAPHGVNAGRAGHVLFTHKELPKDGFGFGVIPWIDVAAEGVEGAMLPESEDLKEATLRFLRASTTMVATRVGHADAFADANQMRINVNRCESSAYCAKIIISFVTKKLPFWLRFSKSLGPEAQLTNALCTYGVSPSQVPRPFCETLMSWGT